MHNEFYAALFDLCETIIQGNQISFASEWFNIEPHNRMVLTLKNYKQVTGLS